MYKSLYKENTLLKICHVDAQLLKSQETQQYWRLQTTDRCMDFKFNVRTKVIRLLSDRRRIFLLEEAGIVRSRIQIRNEYSVEIGSVFFPANHSQTGTLIVDGTKYFFERTTEGLQFMDAKRHPLFTVALPGQLDFRSQEMTALVIAASQFPAEIAYNLLAAG